MISTAEFEAQLNRSFPTAQVNLRESGASTWGYLLLAGRTFAIQVTPADGIGVSEVDPAAEDDLSGHDEVFDTLDAVIAFIQSKLQA